jgi:redox-sensitive bicupin YhaK (pirin superfamily)
MATKVATAVATTQREAILIEDAHVRPMMGIDVLEPVPSRNVPYELSDPFILVHEAVVPIDPERAQLDTTHPHRGFDNLWYVLSGDASTGHSTGPGGTFERARLHAGALLKIRTGRGVYHAESIGEDELREGQIGSFRSVLFWVNLARKDKGVDPTAQVVEPDELPNSHKDGVIVRTLVGDGSPVTLGTEGLILDVELRAGGDFGTSIESGFNAFVWMLDGEASLGPDRRRVARAQIAVLGPGDSLSVTDAQPGTRFLVMAGKPYGEEPIYNGPYVD